MKPVRRDPRAARRDGERGMTLIELLAAMAIAGVLSALMLVSWFSLSDSYSFSVHSNKARDKARLAASRLSREIRDAENSPEVAEVSIVRARPWSILIYTTFNRDGNADPAMRPRLVMFRLYPDGELWRFQDLDLPGQAGHGQIAGVDIDVEPWPGVGYDVAEQVNGEGGQLLIESVVNARVPNTANPTPVFRYAYYATDGSTTITHTINGTNERFKIKSVEINLLVDTNPERSPVYTNLKTTVQLRNQR
jgi:prepilin-type N-terminal cleavage/methylation domain-containing protein